MLVLAVIDFIAGVLSYRGWNWYASMTGGILGTFGLVTLPLDLVGIILVALGEGQFDRTPPAATVTAPDATGAPSGSSPSD